MLAPRFDSSHLRSSADVERDPVALRAAATPGVQRGRVSSGGNAYAEAAVADRNGDVLLLSAPLRVTLKDVALVRSRLLWAGLIALAVALFAGFAAASVFARRLRRLEQAAERIASGDFDEPVEDHGRDEVGELAGAFDRMRLQLARVDDARREFIANASHELRTPIFSLGGFLELFRDEELDEATRREFLETMTEQVERLSKLATDLLDLSRLDAGPLRIEVEPVELAEVASDLREEFAAVARRLDHALEADGSRARIALGDQERVLQIGRALVENALLHTPPGTPVRIVARGTALSRRGRRARASRPTSRSACSPASAASRARAPPGRGSASRSPGSSPCAWAAPSSSSPGPAGRSSRSASTAFSRENEPLATVP